MPSEHHTSYVAFGRPGWQYRKEFRVREWVHSPRVDGKLALKANPYLLDRRDILARYATDGMEATLPNEAPDVWNHSVRLRRMSAEAERVSYAKFRGKLYYGSASLGVTIAQYAEARKLAVQTYQVLQRKQEDHFEELFRRTWKPRELSDRWLRWVFGYLPLYQDLHATASTVIQMTEPREWVRASHTVRDTEPWYGESGQKDLKVRWTRSGLVVVSNHNKWLAERAGLLNPAVVAWDIVPWSFAINMFVNINQLLQSITDFAGLTFTDYNDTVTASYLSRARIVYPGSGSSFGKYFGIDMRRTPGPTPVAPRSLEFRIPEARWETVVTAAALATQRFGKIKGLITKLTN